MKMNRGTAMSLGLCALAGVSFSQKNTVASGGDMFGPGGQINYSIGQLDYTPVNSIGGSLSAGNQQAYVVDVSGIFENNLAQQVSLYPNPATEQVFVSIGELPSVGMYYTVSSFDGKLLLQNSIASSIEALPVLELAKGSYVVCVYSTTQKIKSFNLIKN